jgi:hypothetical protein
MKTIEQVKEELPQVWVRMGKAVILARVSGRANRFATVWFDREATYAFEYSWEAVTRSLNTDEPLIAA